MDDEATIEKKKSLDRLLDDQPRVVSTDAEDFFEKTRDLSPEDYGKEFEKIWSGHRGLIRMSPLKKAAGSGRQ